MAKTKIKGKFATGADVATVHRISQTRQEWLDRQIGEATGDAVVFFTPLTTKAGKYTNLDSKKRSASKRAAAKRSGKTVRLRSKRK